MSTSANNDSKTAEAFASSWNTLPTGSVYSYEQFAEWLAPLTELDVQGKRVLELGCGNGSLMVHLVAWRPDYVKGIDLGESVLSAEANMKSTGFANFEIFRENIASFASDGFDLVYCIGVLHHMKDPVEGFNAVLNNTKPGGRFHCWVYGREGNGLIVYLVDPIRKIASKLPWWFTKYAVAAPLSFLYFLYAHVIVRLKLRFMPLYDYSAWITNRKYRFFWHVAFDQLVTPQTVYIPRETIKDWLENDDRIDADSTYIIFRNGNSWKFGGIKNTSR